jgi:urease gamma subunit
MTIELSKRVDVQVSLGTQSISTRSFDIPLFLTGTAAFTDNYRVYSSADGVLEDFSEGSAAYKFASKAFGGLFPPRTIYIGKRGVTNTIFTPTVADNTVYSLNIKANGVDAFITFTSGTSASAATIVTGLKAAITASAVSALVTVGGTTTLTLASLTTLSAGATTDSLVQSNAYSETSTTAATRVRGLDDSWYYSSIDDHSKTEQEAFAAYADSINSMFVTSSADADILSQGVATDICSVLKSMSYDHAAVLYHPEADTEFPEGAIIGAMAQLEKGTSTLTDKTLSGVTTTNLSETQITVLESKNAMYYVTFAGVGSVFNSKTSSGQFFDTIEFADWLRARVGESIYGVMKRRSDQGLKISYDSAGKAIIKQYALQPAKYGQLVGSVSLDFEPVCRVPTRDEISDNDRANRFLPEVVVELQYTNGIEKVQVRAYVSI